MMRVLVIASTPGRLPGTNGSLRGWALGIPCPSGSTGPTRIVLGNSRPAPLKAFFQTIAEVDRDWMPEIRTHADTAGKLWHGSALSKR